MKIKILVLFSIIRINSSLFATSSYEFIKNVPSVDFSIKPNISAILVNDISNNKGVGLGARLDFQLNLKPINYLIWDNDYHNPYLSNTFG